MARRVSTKTGASAPSKGFKTATGKGRGGAAAGPGSRKPEQKPQVVAFNETTVDAINKSGPPGHEVAHINPREGRLLEALGGSGEKDPVTKITSYETVGKKTGEKTKLPKGKGRGRVDSTHQVAVLTDPEVEALNTMRWRDKDRGYSSGSGPEIMALAEQNDRPFDFLEYRGEIIPTLNDSGSYGGGASGSGSTGGNVGGGSDGGEKTWERIARLAREKAAREKIAKAKAKAKKDKEEAEQKERDRIAKLKADADKKVQDAIKAAEKKEAARLKVIADKKIADDAEADRLEKIRKEEEAKAERDRVAALEATRVEEERIQKLEDERIAKEEKEEADRVVAEAEEKERIEKEAEEKAEKEYQEKLEKEEADALALQEEINEVNDIDEQSGNNESDDFLEGEGEYEGDETDTPYMEEDGSFDQIYDQEFGQDEDNLDLEGEEPEQDTGTYYDFNDDLGDEVGGDVAGENNKYWYYDPYDYGDELDEDEDDAISDTSQDDPSGQPVDYGEPDDDDTDTFDSDADDDFDDSLEGFVPEDGEKDSETLEEEAEDEESDINWDNQPDDDDTDTFDDSGQDDPADIEPDDDDTDTDDTSGYDPSLGNVYYGEDDDTDTFDSNEDAGGTTTYDPYTGDSDDDLGNAEIDPTDDPDGSGGDDPPIVIPDGGDGDDTITPDGGDDTEETGDDDLDKRLKDLDAQYAKYGETDYEKLYHDEFSDDLTEDYTAASKGLDYNFLTSGDRSEFNTAGDTVNDQQDYLGELLEGDQQTDLNTQATNYASGANKSIEDWYTGQQTALKDGSIDSFEMLDLSDWSDPTENYNPEFYGDEGEEGEILYDKRYYDPSKSYYDASLADPEFVPTGESDPLIPEEPLPGTEDGDMMTLDGKKKKKKKKVSTDFIEAETV